MVVHRTARAAALLALVVLAAVLPAAPIPARGAPRAVAIPNEAEILDGLHPAHPRLLLRAADVDALRARIADDPFLAGWYAALEAQATALLAAPPITYTLADDGLLDVAQEAVRRLQTLGLVWLVDGDRGFAARGWHEMEAMAAFPDWHPSHFLDTAELTHAMAIGYDWLFDALDDVQRAAAVDAIATKGLQPAADAYDGVTPIWDAWWTNVSHNWNQVTGGGVTIGALAIGDVEPELAAHVLHEAVTRLPRALAGYAPDGGWAEGPNYWQYATSYTVAAIATLDSALGDDFGLSGTEGLDRTGDVALHHVGPTGQRYNFADDGEPRLAPNAPFLLWLATRFGRADHRAYQLDHAQPSALDVLWYRAESGTDPVVPLDRLFCGIDVATMRGSRTDGDSTWVGVKGGQPAINHAQLDLGSFVMEADGVRWAVDLGWDSYGLPGYFNSWTGGERWTYYRNRAEGHNALLLDPGMAEDQVQASRADVVRFATSATDAYAVVDLAEAYGDRPVQRGVRLLDRERVLVQDEMDLAAPADTWWFLHTRAAIAMADGGRTAVLTQDGETLTARVLSPAGATFSVRDAVPLPGTPNPAGQATNAGIRKLTLHLPAATDERVAVLLEPGDGSGPTVDVEPIASWHVGTEDPAPGADQTGAAGCFPRTATPPPAPPPPAPPTAPPAAPVPAAATYTG